MRFAFYGRFDLHVTRRGGSWEVFRLVDGKRKAVSDIFIPAAIEADEIERYLNDLLHELARPGKSIRRIE